MHYSLYIACGLVVAALTDAISLGTAASFGIIASTAITNTGNTVVTGELGIYPNGATSITGFLPGVSGLVHGGDATALTAHNDAMSAYTAAAALTTTQDLTGQDLGGKTLTAGVYAFSSSVGLTGTLTLDGQNNPNAQFVFKIGSTLTTATAASIILVNGAQVCNVYFQVGSSATLGTSTVFVGNILASASVTVNSGVSVQGGLYALSAAVTLIDDSITIPKSCTSGTSPTSSTTTSASTSVTTISKPASIVTITATFTVTSSVTKTVTVTAAKTTTTTVGGTTKTSTVTAKCTAAKKARYVM